MVRLLVHPGGYHPLVQPRKGRVLKKPFFMGKYMGRKNYRKLGRLENGRRLIEKYARPIPISGCWIWSGALNTRGYGHCHPDGKQAMAHRLSYEIFVGALKEDELVLHRCDIRCCVNPHHLYAGSQVDNMRDMHTRGRAVSSRGSRTHCVAGHEYSPENTKILKDKSRLCLICRSTYQRLRRAKKKHAANSKQQGE